MNRRDFLRTAGGVSGATAALGAAGPAAAQEGTATPGDGGTATPGGEEGGDGGEDGNGGGDGGESAPPDYGNWFSDVGNYDGETVNARGESEVTVMVGTEGNGGNFAFDPPAVHVDAGTTLLFEWTGEGGGHNVVGQDGVLDFTDIVSDAGVHYEETIEEDGIYQYVCEPHQGQGMKGAVVVGDDYPSVDTGGGDGERAPVDPEHMGVPFQAHFVGLATIVAILVSLVFAFFQLKYAESPNTKGGSN